MNNKYQVAVQLRLLDGLRGPVVIREVMLRRAPEQHSEHGLFTVVEETDSLPLALQLLANIASILDYLPKPADLKLAAQLQDDWQFTHLPGTELDWLDPIDFVLRRPISPNFEQVQLYVAVLRFCGVVL